MKQPAGTPAPAAPKVFICYRREETAAHAGRLYDAMVARFGEGNVFMDVDMPPGVDFVERITAAVSACQVLIAVIGPAWATLEDDRGEARIADPNDFVRLEVETSLRRPELTLIPVLVAGARMPRPEDLPAELQAITRRNALELSEARWRYDVGRLNETLDHLLAADPAERERAQIAAAAASGAKSPPAPEGASGKQPDTPRPDRRRPLRWAAGAAIPLIAIVIAVLVLSGGDGGACDPGGIECVVETAWKPTGPEDCTKLETQAYLEQTNFRKGEEAVRHCEINAANTANDPDSVHVSKTREVNRSATAEVSFEGGFYDGQTLVVDLVKGRGGQWRVNYIKRFEGFDKARYLEAYEGNVLHADPPLTPEEARCVAGNLARFVGSSELEDAILAGDQAPFSDAYVKCNATR
jgi:TIR domain